MTTNNVPSDPECCQKRPVPFDAWYERQVLPRFEGDAPPPRGLMQMAWQAAITDYLQQITPFPTVDLAHEIWAAAQQPPGEPVVDAVSRIVDILDRQLRAEPMAWMTHHDFTSSQLTEHKDTERYRKFINAGLPITYLGEDYHDKQSLDAAIDATPSPDSTGPYGDSHATNPKR